MAERYFAARGDAELIASDNTQTALMRSADYRPASRRRLTGLLEDL